MLVSSAALINNAVELRCVAARDGYLYLPGLVAPADVIALRDRVVAECAARGWVEPQLTDGAVVARPGAHLTGAGYDDPDWITLQQAILPSPQFLALGDHSAISGVLKSLFAGPFSARHGDICRVALPGAQHLTTPAHHDHSYIGGEPDLWTAWWPLTRCRRALGPLAVQSTDGDWRSTDLSVGDVILFHCRTVHRALPNTTDRGVRLSVDYRYRP